MFINLVIIPPISTMKHKMVIESADRNIECLIFRFIPSRMLITCWLSAPLMIDGTPIISMVYSPPYNISSGSPYNVVISKMKYKAPVMKLITIIPTIENLVFGRVVMYLDNPATLLILDIIFLIIIFNH